MDLNQDLEHVLSDMMNGSTKTTTEYAFHAQGGDPVSSEPDNERYEYRVKILDDAKHAITKDRNHTYGSPSSDFLRASKIASVATGKEITAADIALIQIAVKLSRLNHSPGHLDSCIDIAGYIACYYEVIRLHDDRLEEKYTQQTFTFDEA